MRVRLNADPFSVRELRPLKVEAKIQAHDYRYRPSGLEKFPLYFFLAGCVARTQLGPESLVEGAYRRGRQ